MCFFLTVTADSRWVRDEISKYVQSRGAPGEGQKQGLQVENGDEKGNSLEAAGVGLADGGPQYQLRGV